AQCSDLRAIAWGMTYADFLRGIFPLRFTEWGKNLNRYDRGWALEQAIWRNRQKECNPGSFHPKAAKESNGDLNFNKYPRMPRYSLNTTTAESGSRYVVGNYTIAHFDSKRCSYPAKNESQGEDEGKENERKAAVRESQGLEEVSPADSFV